MLALVAGTPTASADPPTRTIAAPSGDGCAGDDCRALRAACLEAGGVYREVATAGPDGSRHVRGWCQPTSGRALTCVGVRSCALLEGYCIAAGGDFHESVVTGVTFGVCNLPSREPRGSIACRGAADCAALDELCIAAKGVYTETHMESPTTGEVIITGSCKLPDPE